MKKTSKIILFSSLCLMFILSMGLIFVKPVYAKASYIPSDYRLLTSADIGKTFGVDLEPNFYIDNSVVVEPDTATFYLYFGATFENAYRDSWLVNDLYFHVSSSGSTSIRLEGTPQSPKIYDDSNGWDSVVYFDLSLPFALVESTGSITCDNTWFIDNGYNNFFYVKDKVDEPDPIPGVENEFVPYLWQYQPSSIIYEYTNATNEYQSSLYIPKFNEIGSSFNDYQYVNTFLQGNQEYMIEVYNFLHIDEVYEFGFEYYLPNNTEYLPPHINIYFQNFVYFYDENQGDVLPMLVLYKYDDIREFEFQSIEFTFYDKNGTKYIDSVDSSYTSEWFVTDYDDYTYYDLTRALEYVVANLSSSVRTSPIFVTDVNVNLGYEREFVNTSNILRKSFRLFQMLSTSSVYYGASFQDYLNSLEVLIPPDPIEPIDMSSWLLTSIGAFMNAELFPGFALGGLLAVIIAFPIVVWFLKMLAGG